MAAGKLEEEKERGECKNRTQEREKDVQDGLDDTQDGTTSSERTVAGDSSSACGNGSPTSAGRADVERGLRDLGEDHVGGDLEGTENGYKSQYRSLGSSWQK